MMGFSHEPGHRPTGLIDIHSHMLPDVDDGSMSVAESLECVERLIEAGFVGTICTPHMWEHTFLNTPSHARALTMQMQDEINAAGLQYRLWPGGELRLSETIIDWMKVHGVPTLANSRCVLVDMWEDRWPNWTNDIFEWLIRQGYQPILAHPERMAAPDLDDRIKVLERMGVWLQGNFQSMTGENGYAADRYIRQLLEQQRLRFMALDMHGMDALESRLDGMALVEAEFSSELVGYLAGDQPRKHLTRGR